MTVHLALWVGEEGTGHGGGDGHDVVDVHVHGVQLLGQSKGGSGRRRVEQNVDTLPEGGLKVVEHQPADLLRLAVVAVVQPGESGRVNDDDDDGDGNKPSSLQGH